MAPSPPHPIPQCRCTFLLGIKGQRLSFLPFWAFGLGEGGAFEGGGCSWAGEVVQRLPWGEGFCCTLGCRLEPPRPREPVKRIPCSALRTGGEGHPQGQRVFSKEKELDAWSSLALAPTPTSSPAPPRTAMDSATKDEMQPSIPPGSSCPGPEWPEQERAEQLARGAALKWASGIFYRPEQLARLSQYRSREVQRTCSLEARIKSVVQSYLEGVKIGVWQLAQASEALQAAREALGQAHGLLQGLAEATQTLKPLREQVAQHKQLQVLSQLLPRLWAVPTAVAHTRTLIDAQQLLEAYVCLRELEQLQEETWAPLGGLELPVFEALGPLAEALGQAVEVAAGAAGQLAREDPALLVAAVRIAEVDAGYTPSLELTPRDWRQRCLQALQEGLERTHFGTPLLLEPGALKGWLEALRVALPAELATAEALVAPCCPPHYKVVQLWTHTLHHGLRRCLQQLLEGPELDASDAFTLLHWALHVYQGPEMMGSLELGPEADVSQLEPLLTLENIEQLEATFVAQIQANVAQWLQNALDGEVAEWNREQEPGTDSSGFYHSPMPAIVLQILEENIRVTSLVSESLQQRMHAMALSELGTFLRSFSDALIRFSRDHVRGEAMAPHYVPYLLATLNHQSALSSSVSVLLPDGVASGALAPVKAALDELQRRICRLVLEALLAELQVRLQVGMGVEEIQHTRVCFSAGGMLGLVVPPALFLLPHPAAPVHGSALTPVAFEPRASGRRVQEDGALLPGFQARAESCGPAAPGRGGTYGGTAVPACADAGPPGVPRRGREDPGGRAPAARRGPASGALPGLGESPLGEQLGGSLSGWAGPKGDSRPTRGAQGLEESVQCAPVLLALRDLLNLRDPMLLGLEVAGLRQKFPDVSEDHVSALLDLRGDVSREQRLAALSSLQAGPQPSPAAGRRALFSLVPAPTPTLSSCLPSGPCA